MIPLYSCHLDPLTLPVMRDPEIVPAAGEMYRHRKYGWVRAVDSITHGRIVWFKGENGESMMFPLVDFWNSFIHASAREDVT